MVSGEPDDLSGLLDVFIDSLGNDNVRLMKCMFRIDKLDRLAFADFLTSARGRIALSLRESSICDLHVCTGSKRGSLVYAESVLVKAEEMLNSNVNAGQISGMICASLLK